MHSCRANTQIDVPGLVNGTRHRHQCFVLNRLCLFNGTILPATAGGQAERSAKQLATTLTVRSMFGSHQTFKLGYLHPMDAAAPQSPAAKLVRLAVSRAGFMRCVPLVWVPTWAFSFAEHFINSVVPVHELMEAGLIDEHVLLRPDLNSRPMGRYGFYQMLSALSAERTAGLRDAAPKCTDRHATREGGAPPWCVPRCYQKLVICNFRSTFDAYAARMAPWSAAQRVARRLVPRPPPAEPAVAARRVLLVNRTGTRFARSLHNLPQLLAACAHSEAPRTVCAVSKSSQSVGRHQALLPLSDAPQLRDTRPPLSTQTFANLSTSFASLAGARVRTARRGGRRGGGAARGRAGGDARRGAHVRLLHAARRGARRGAPVPLRRQVARPLLPRPRRPRAEPALLPGDRRTRTPNSSPGLGPNPNPNLTSPAPSPSPSPTPHTPPP